MKRFRINKKKSFYTPDKEIKIYDSRGIIFYDSNEVENFKGYFTLPRIGIGNSTYLTNGNLAVINNFSHYSVRLPNPEWSKNHDFSKFKVRFGRNPNKCTIFHKKKLIFFDNSFKRKPYYELAFILFHEMGHNYYITEQYADSYAVKEMLKRGYTPYQILIAAIDSLSKQPEAFERKQNVLNVLKNS